MSARASTKSAEHSSSKVMETPGPKPLCKVTCQVLRVNLGGVKPEPGALTLNSCANRAPMPVSGWSGLGGKRSDAPSNAMKMVKTTRCLFVMTYNYISFAWFLKLLSVYIILSSSCHSAKVWTDKVLHQRFPACRYGRTRWI